MDYPGLGQIESIDVLKPRVGEVGVLGKLRLDFGRFAARRN